LSEIICKIFRGIYFNNPLNRACPIFAKGFINSQKIKKRKNMNKLVLDILLMACPILLLSYLFCIEKVRNKEKFLNIILGTTGFLILITLIDSIKSLSNNPGFDLIYLRLSILLFHLFFFAIMFGKIYHINMKEFKHHLKKYTLILSIISIFTITCAVLVNIEIDKYTKVTYVTNGSITHYEYVQMK